MRSDKAKQGHDHAVTGSCDSQSFPTVLRHFRIMTFSAAMTLLGAFFIFAFNRANGLPFSLVAIGLATLIELVGGQRLLRSYRELQKSNAAKQTGSPKIIPERVPKNEGQLRQNELTFPYSKCDGERSSEFTKEAGRDRIEKLVDKSRLILSGTSALEKDELYSEVVLSFDRATRTALNAILLSIGVETQGRDIEIWFPHLKRVLHNMNLRDIRYLGALRDQVNKGYDATEEEAWRAKGIAELLIDGALKYLKTYLTKGNSQQNSPPTRFFQQEAKRMRAHKAGKAIASARSR